MVTAHLRSATQRCSAEDRRQQILEAATELFADKGFRGTTTREIAELAKVNEAIIFRHFQSKEELYWAVIEHKCRDRRAHRVLREYVAKDLTVEEVFKGVALEFLRTKDRNSSLNRLLLFSSLEHHELSERFFRTHMTEVYEDTAKYIRQQVKAGKLRDVDAVLAARGFWGMLVYHFWLQELFGAEQYQPFDVEHVSNTLVEVWLKGMLPRSQRGGE
jgi:AcrR family transcriptional regulator